MKDTYYFTHDYNARGDEKIIRLVKKLGWEGYGIYWVLIEKLYEGAGRISSDTEILAFDLRLEPETIRAVLRDFGLFLHFRDGTFCSNAVSRRLLERKLRSDLAKKSSIKRWGDYHGNTTRSYKIGEANHMQPHRGRKEINKASDLESPSKSQKPYEAKTGIQKVICAYKISKGISWDDAGWDKANFSRASVAAKSLIEAFSGEEQSAAEWMVGIGKKFDSKALNWTLETIARHAWDNKGTIMAAKDNLNEQ